MTQLVIWQRPVTILHSSISPIPTVGRKSSSWTHHTLLCFLLFSEHGDRVILRNVVHLSLSRQWKHQTTLIRLCHMRHQAFRAQGLSRYKFLIAPHHNLGLRVMHTSVWWEMCRTKPAPRGLWFMTPTAIPHTPSRGEQSTELRNSKPTNQPTNQPINQPNLT